jgi:hypothetical protein
MGYIIGFIWGAVCFFFIQTWLEDRGWSYWRAVAMCTGIMLIGCVPLGLLVRLLK